MKKAILVTFEIKTRVIVDADYGNAVLTNLDWEVAKVAADKIKSNPDSYIDAENMTEVVYDLEDPYNPDYDKVDLRIPSTQEMIDFIKTNPKCTTNYVNGLEISFPTNELSIDNPIKLGRSTWIDIDSIMFTENNHVKVHYSNPNLNNAGISFVDWNDISTDLKLKILKAIGYYEN